MPLAFTVDGEPVPSMAAELAARATGAPASAKVATAGAVADTITLNFAGGADDIPTFSLADLRACVEKDDKDFFRRHFDGKVVLIGTVLDVEDRKITSKRFATAPEGARAERCALPTPAAGQTFTRNSISGVYVHATAVNNLIRGDALTEFGRIGTGIASFALAALAVAAALALGPHGAALDLPRHCGGLERGRDVCVSRRAGAAAGRASADRARRARRHDRLSPRRRRPHHGRADRSEARA